MSKPVTRRRALVVLGSMAVSACVGGPEHDCVDGPSTGVGTYCLVDGLVVRVFGGAQLGVGEAMLAAVDDATAVIVARDANGLFARSAICTHACCTVALCRNPSCGSATTTPNACGTRRETTDVVLCPCHGSRFTLADGVPIVGPATTPLPAYALERDTDDLLVDTGRVVDASLRL